MLDLFGKANSMDLLSKNESVLKYSGEYDRTKVKISIVVPTYKRGNLLAETIDSCEPIYNHPEYEILIVFNAQGESGDIVEHVKRIGICNIRVYENLENIGMFQNWNQGSLLATGEWISIIHDDDMFEPAYFNMLPELLKKLPSTAAYINFNGNLVAEEQYAEVPKRRISTLAFRKATIRDVRVLGMSPFFAATCGTLVKRETLIALGGFDASTYPSGDVLFPIKLINNQYTCYICSDKLNFYRKQQNASLKKEVMDLFIYYYGELQRTIYTKETTGFLYRCLGKCLYFKSVWHVFVQADENHIVLNSMRPDQKIQKTLKYKVMDICQRAYWKLKRNRLFVEFEGGRR